MSTLAERAMAKGRVRWGICALLFFVITINYVDRQVIGVLKPVLEEEFGWTEVDYGNIVTSFQAAYALGLLFVGRWLDRIGTRKGVAIAIAVWSIAAAFHAGARSVVQFMLVRMTLGIGEAGAYPGAVKAVAEWFPRRERALAVGILNAGANVGVIVTPLVVLPIAFTYGWQSAFIVTGAMGILLLAAWLLIYRAPRRHPKLGAAELAHIQSDNEPPPARVLEWRQAIRNRQAWAFIAGKFFTDPVWYLFLFWLPDFLAKTQGMELFPKSGTGILSTIGPALILVYLLADVGSIAGGWFSSHLIGRSWNPNRARKTTMLICAVCAVPVSMVVSSPTPLIAVLIVGLATAAHQGFSANLFTLISDMYPSHAVGMIAGMGGFAGAIGGILMAQATGWTLELTGSYVPLVAYAGFAYLIALGVIHWLVPRLERAPVEAQES